MTNTSAAVKKNPRQSLCTFFPREEEEELPRNCIIEENCTKRLASNSKKQNKTKGEGKQKKKEDPR